MLYKIITNIEKMKKPLDGAFFWWGGTGLEFDSPCVGSADV